MAPKKIEIRASSPRGPAVKPPHMPHKRAAPGQRKLRIDIAASETLPR